MANHVWQSKGTSGRRPVHVVEEETEEVREEFTCIVLNSTHWC
ncbi:MAG TPA: hypothetical protein VNL35_06735 [Chloroflexota bacterium]|nr:hypothetical protein [Chloroflexota bacterium]